MSKKKKGVIIKDQGRLASPLDMQVDQNLYIGQPGYRTRRGRSGLDYIESQAEFGHSLGYLIRRLFLLKLRVRRPFSMLLMAFLGLLLSLPGMLILIELLNSVQSDMPVLTERSLRSPGFSLLSGGLTGLFLVGLAALMGILLLLNLCVNLYRLLAQKQKRKPT
jgi:hypothetical protein